MLGSLKAVSVSGGNVRRADGSDEQRFYGNFSRIRFLKGFVLLERLLLATFEGK